MAKKKTEDTTFDWKKAIKELNLSKMMKTGLEYYINCNNLNPKNANELNRILNDYKKLPIGA